MSKRFNIKEWQESYTIKEAAYMDSHSESKLNNTLDIIKQVYKSIANDEPTKNHKKIKQEILKYIEKALQ